MLPTIRKTFFIAFLLAWAFSRICAPETGTQEKIPGPAVPFVAVDVYLDTGDQQLAAYQIEISEQSGNMTIVGIEGGEHPAFKEPPYYDPKALMNNRVIIAAFNTGRDLPRGKTRIARIHVQVKGDYKPRYITKLIAAASPEGKRIVATVRVSEAHAAEDKSEKTNP